MVQKRFCVMCRKVKKAFFGNFPLDEKRCRVWVKLSGDLDLVHVPIEKLHSNRFLCGIHFKKTDYTKTKKYLKRSAIPKLNLPNKPLTEEQLFEFPCHVHSAVTHTAASMVVCSMPSISQQHVPSCSSIEEKTTVLPDHNYTKSYEKVIWNKLRNQKRLNSILGVKKNGGSKAEVALPTVQIDDRKIEEDIKAMEWFIKKTVPMDVEDDQQNLQDDVRSVSSGSDIAQDVDVNICRICLQSNSKLLSIESYGLSTAYEQLTGVSVEHDDGLPRELCVECATLLDKYHKFRTKSIRGDQLLRQIYVKDNLPSKPLEEIEQSISSLVSPIDFNPEVTVIDIEPQIPDLIENATQCDLEKDIIVQSVQDLEMTVVDDDNFDSFLDTLTGENAYHDINSEIRYKTDFNNTSKAKSVYDLINYSKEEKLSSQKKKIKILIKDKLEGGMSILKKDETTNNNENETQYGVDEDDGSMLNKVHGDDDEIQSEINMLENDNTGGDDDEQMSSNKEICDDDDEASIKEENDILEQSIDPLNTEEITQTQDENLIQIHFDLTTMPFKERVERHKEKINILIKYRFQCHTCFRGFTNKNDFDEHRIKHPLMQKGEQKCMICQRSFIHVPDLRRHIESTHLFKYECRNCRKLLYDRKSALRHMKTHIGPVVS